MVPAGFHLPAGGRGTDRERSAIRHVSSRTARKSSPLEDEKAPGTFSHTMNRGIIPQGLAVLLPRFLLASVCLISFMIRICSIKRPERSPASPARFPAMLRSWQGEPPAITSTGGRLAPSSFVISPTWSIAGKCFFVTSMGNDSISLAHTGRIPFWTAASGNPPIPSNRLPSRSVFPQETAVIELFACHITSLIGYFKDGTEAFPALQVSVLFSPAWAALPWARDLPVRRSASQ